jgi:hypothetical protein
LTILLRDPDLPLNGTQHPHVLKYIPVFPCRLATTEGRSLQIVNTFLAHHDRFQQQTIERIGDDLRW